MTGPTDRTTAPHYQWGEACDGWRLLDRPDLSVIEERMPPGTSETMHRHRHATQLFYVLEGELTFRLLEGAQKITPGRAFVVNPTDLHQARNEGQTDARFLVVSSPSTAQDRETP